MFIGRKEELQSLNSYWEKVVAEGQFVILYGRRRVGKTELVKEFMKDKDRSYFLATKTNASDQLQNFARQVFGDLGFKTEVEINFRHWREFFNLLKDRLLAKPKKRLIILDEFPYLVSSDPAIPSLFQYGWDECLKNTQTMLILLGSSINMMVKHSLAYSSPLYGRRSGQFEIKPFDFETSKKFVSNLDFESSFGLYSILSGIPAYLRRVNLNQTFTQNIQELFFKNDSFLASEPELLLAEEFDQPTNFMTVLKAIGFNQTRYSEILNATSLHTSQLPFYLKTLLKLRLIERLAPITDKNPEITKNGRYAIKDKFLRFYFSFILPNISQIEAGGGHSLLQSKADLLRQIVAKSYEQESLEFILKAVEKGQLPEIYKLGRWWNKKAEIDLVGLGELTSSIMFVETKWTNQKVGLGVLKDLHKKSVEVKWREAKRTEYFVLISKSGFRDEVLQMAKIDPNLFLIEREDIVK